MTKLENALVWLYVKTWGKFGDHVMDKKDLWNFGADDLETAIMGIAYPRKREKTERVKARVQTKSKGKLWEMGNKNTLYTF